MRNNGHTTDTLNPENSTKEATESSSSTEDDSEPEEYEVEKLVDICYGDPDKTGERGLKFKVWQEDICHNFVVGRLYSLVFTGLRMFFSPSTTCKIDILHVFALLRHRIYAHDYFIRCTGKDIAATKILGSQQRN